MQRNRLSILIAEDDVDDQFLFRTAYGENGFEDDLLFLDNGHEVIQYLMRKKEDTSGNTLPDLLVLDLNMPKKDGREVLAELKCEPVFNTMPVVVFSTTSNENERTRCVELGASAYFTKPVTYEALKAVMRQIREMAIRSAH